MKRIVIYLLVLGAALVFPADGMDISKLQPVGLVQLYMVEEKVVIKTDTGDSGIGNSVHAAFKNMEDTTPGVIFLDTADFLLVSASAKGELDALAEYLKPSIRVCIAEENIDPVQAAEYLAMHRPSMRLKELDKTYQGQKLLQENGRLRLQ